MDTVAVGVNGFGTIGRRVASAVRRQPDMELAGVAKRTADATTRQAVERLDTVLHLIDEPNDVEPLVRKSDVIVDATPSGVGETYAPIYDDFATPAVFQGGEDADIADASFNAYALREGYGSQDASSYRVVSCNTTGLARTIAAIDARVQPIQHASVTLIRRAGDPGETDRGPVNDVIPDPVEIPSHHAPDVNTIFPDTSITTTAVKVPTTEMHMHSVTLTLAEAARREPVEHALSEYDRIATIDDPTMKSGGSIREVAYEAGRPHGSVYENCLWTDSIHVEDNRMSFMQGIHQRSDTVPETVDAVRLLATETSLHDSIQRTDEALNIGDLFSL